MKKIITFPCVVDKIFIYEVNCGYIPSFPYVRHNTLELAKEHLESKMSKNKVEIKEVVYKSRD